MDDFFFLKQAQTPDTFTPFVVTASASEKASAGRVLAQGTFNLITTHVNLGGGDADHPWALRQNKLRALIASEKALEKYRELMEDYPEDRKVDEAFRERSLSYKRPCPC